MTSDFWVVVWKESKEIFALGLTGGGGRRNPLVPLVLIGVFIPWRIGDKIFHSGQFLLYATLPALMIATVVCDTFAGERERHTLETLLASRLPDRAILFGKITACLGYCWIFSLIIFLMALVVIGTVHGSGVLGDLSGVWVVLLAQPLLGMAMTCAGVLASLRASTVRQAQQILATGFIGIGAVLVAVIGVLPTGIKTWLSGIVNGWGPTSLTIAVSFAVVGIDLILLLAATARFRRTKLILP